MAGKKKNVESVLKHRLGQVNQVIGKLETEIEKAVGKIVKSGEKSSQVIRKNFDEVFERISTSPLYSKATEKTGELSKELRRLTDDVVNKVKKIDLTVGQNVLKDVRTNLDQIVAKLQESNIVELAKDKAVESRRRFLHVLRIPSREEVTELNRKVSSLEKKVSALSKKSAVAA